jgi:hypothetical protein
LKNLKELGIVEEAKGKGKGKLFFYRELVTLLTSGTQPIA